MGVPHDTRDGFGVHAPAAGITSVEGLRKVLVELIRVLKCLRDAFVQHNDLWSPNLLWVPPGRFVVIDFGLAQLLVRDDGGSSGAGADVPESLEPVVRRVSPWDTDFARIRAIGDAAAGRVVVPDRGEEVPGGGVESTAREETIVARAVSFLERYSIGSTSEFPDIASPYIVDIGAEDWSFESGDGGSSSAEDRGSEAGGSDAQGELRRGSDGGELLTGALQWDAQLSPHRQKAPSSSSTTASSSDVTGASPVLMHSSDDGFILPKDDSYMVGHLLKHLLPRHHLGGKFAFVTDALIGGYSLDWIEKQLLQMSIV